VLELSHISLNQFISIELIFPFFLDLAIDSVICSMIEATADPGSKDALLQKLKDPSAPLTDFIGHDLCVELFRANDPVVHA
jgi:hypothetical protein